MNLLPATANPQDPSGVSVDRPSDVLEARAAAKGQFTTLLLGLGAVALLVGAIGIANIMVISVLERRGEIGLRRRSGRNPRPHQHAIPRRVGALLAGDRRCLRPRDRRRCHRGLLRREARALRGAALRPDRRAHCRVHHRRARRALPGKAWKAARGSSPTEARFAPEGSCSAKWPVPMRRGRRSSPAAAPWLGGRSRCRRHRRATAAGRCDPRDGTAACNGQPLQFPERCRGRGCRSSRDRASGCRGRACIGRNAPARGAGPPAAGS